jgi:hypothetical protein
VRLALATSAVVSLFLLLPGEVLAAAPLPQQQLYEITSPRSDEEIRGSVEIVGSARLGPEFQFYKVEYAFSATPDAWTSIGEVHRQEKTNETLEIWHTTSLPDGAYYLHLVVVKQDGNLVETVPFRVQIANTEPLPTPTPEESPTPTATIFVPTPTVALVEQPTVVRAQATAAAEPESSATMTVEPETNTTVSIPSAGVFVRQFVFGAFVAAVLFAFAGVVFLLRRFI